MEIEILYAEHSDLDQLADLLAELFALENDFHPDREKQLRGLRLILDTRRWAGFLCCAIRVRWRAWRTC